jgi:hypothetical protein
MMTNSILLESISADGLKEMIQEAVRAEFLGHQPKPEDKLKTRKEAAQKLRITTVSLDKLVITGKLTGFRINGRVLFKESDLERALVEIPIRRKQV